MFINVLNIKLVYLFVRQAQEGCGISDFTLFQPLKSF